MNKKEALNQLKSLHYDMEHFQEIESKEEDVKALEYAIKELEITAQEVPVQEQSDNIYPTEIEIIRPIETYDSISNILRISDDAIRLKLTISSNLYLKQNVKEELNLACQKLLKYFC